MFSTFTNWLWAQLVTFAAWLGPEANSVRLNVNWSELAKILIMAASSGTLTAAGQVFLTNFTSILIDPSTASGITLGITAAVAVVEFFRRFFQGTIPPSRPRPA